MNKQQIKWRKPVTDPHAAKKPNARVHGELGEDELKQVAGGGKVSLSDFSFTCAVD